MLDYAIISHKKRSIKTIEIAIFNGNKIFNGDNQACLNLIIEFLDHFYNIQNLISNHVQNIPLQTNGYDCGMFILKYAECLSVNKEFNFNQVIIF